MDIIAYSAEKQDNQILFSRNDGTYCKTDNYLFAIEYLLKPCDYAVVWNLEHFVELFCSLIPQSVVKELKDKGKAYLPLPYKQKLYYQAGRVFAITWGYGREVNFYALNRYADEEITDVMELKKLADKVVDAYRAFGLTPKRLDSPVAVYSQILDGIDYPRACDLPDEALPMINACSKTMWREWREVFKLGHWNAGEVSDYDISAAYPHLMANLPDIGGATFFESDTMPDDNEYSWGELEGILTIDKDVTPFYNIGTWQEQITTDHLWAINKYEWGKFELKHGYFLKLPQYYKKPFKKVMLDLYETRQNNNQIVQKIAKGISVGIGGKLAQIYATGILGDNTQPIYARMITSRCGIRVADFLWRNGLQNDAISVLVDGCLVQGDYKLGGKSGIGAWKKNPQSPFLVASLLYQWGLDKKPNKKIYGEMIAMIKEKPNDSVYRDIDLNLLTWGRRFKDRPRTGGQLLEQKYNSEPISMGVLIDNK